MKEPSKLSRGNVPHFKGRSSIDYQRKKGRQSAKVLWIICEGSETEPNYFKALRSTTRIRNVLIKVIPGGKSKVTPANLVKETSDILTRENWNPKDGDEAWCIFDFEKTGTHQDLSGVIEKAKRLQINLVISNPAFEYWFLLHYIKTDKPFIDADEACRELCNYIPNYNKSMPIYRCLQDRTHIAIKNSTFLRNHSENNWRDYPNPSTEVDILVNHLLSLE